MDESFEFDAIVYATGFDAMTGTLMRIDIRGRNVRVGSECANDRSGISPCHGFELVSGERERIAQDAAFRSAEGHAAASR